MTAVLPVIAVLSIVRTVSPVTSQVCVAFDTLALFVAVSLSIVSRSTACVTLICQSFVFSASVTYLLSSESAISSVVVGISVRYASVPLAS